MEYTANEILGLVMVLIVFPLGMFGAGFFIGKINGSKDLKMIANSLWIIQGKRTKIDGKLEKIEKVIEAIQRGSE